MKSTGLILLVVAAAGLLATSPVEAADLNRPVPIKPEHARLGEVRIWDPGFTSRTNFQALPVSAKTGGSLASGDLDGDGQTEIVVGAGPGVEPYLNIFRTDGTKVSAFLTREASFRGGVRVAVADFDGDGKQDIAVSFGPGAAPLVKIMDLHGSNLHEMMAYAEKFTGGVHVAAGDLDGDGRAELITSPGPNGGPHIRIWNGDLTNRGQDFFAFDATMTDGTSIAVVRTPQNAMLIAAAESWSDPLVRRFAFSPTPTLIHEFYAFDPGTRHGLTLSAFDRDGDGVDEIVSARNGGASPEVRLHDLFGTKIGGYLLHDPTYRGSLSLAQLKTDKTRLMSFPAAPVVVGPLDKEQFIFVNLKEQRLYAYEKGRLARTFLVSTGTWKYPTPIVNTTIQSKVLMKDYKWVYGKNHPDNYFLPNVKYNLQVKGPYFIHYAYWHNNFGHRMSHGCINVGFKDAEWIYNWADVGTAVQTG